MQKSILMFLCSLLLTFFIKTNVLATEPLPKEFEAVYEEILNDPSYASLGNPKGTYVIIDFFDYRCGFCKQLHKDLYNLVHSKEGQNIRWISIETPVFGYKHNQFSDLVLATRKYGVYNKIFDEMAKFGLMSTEQVLQLFEGLGHDPKQLVQEAEKTSFRPIYKKHFNLYFYFNTKAVPVVIVNKKYQTGVLKEEQLQQIIKEAKPSPAWRTPFLRFF